MRNNLSATFRYATYGVLLGLLFLGATTAALIFMEGYPRNWESILQAQRSSALLWVIDTMPIFLGMFGGLAGRREDRLTQANEELKRRAEENEQAVHDLESLQSDLKGQLVERTADLAFQSAQLEAAAHVARTAAAIQDLEQLLDETVRVITNAFGFDQAAFFLLDKDGQFAVLRATSSQHDQDRLAQDHRFRVGEGGIVGFAAAAGQPRIALDVKEDTAYSENPDVPRFGSEIALPLIARGRTIGVLNIQSKEDRAFSTKGVATLQILADQVALAIDNARLLEESRTRIQEVDALLGHYGSESWRQMASERPDWAYVFDGVDVLPRASTQEEKLPPQLKIPIYMRDETIGSISVTLDGRSPTPEEVALAQTAAEQASLALESAWLFHETQRRATQHQLVSEITARMRESLDVGTVLRVAADEIHQALRLDRVAVCLGMPETDQANTPVEGNGNARQD